MRMKLLTILTLLAITRPQECNQNAPKAVDEAKIAVWRPSSGIWYIKGPGQSNWAATKNNIGIQCGTQNDIPVPLDYFNEGTTRLAVFRPSNGVWYIKGLGIADWSGSKDNLDIQCGVSGDVPVPGDYFGFGSTSIAVWRPSDGNWYIKGQGVSNWGASSGNMMVQCGGGDDIPVPADYFNEGKLRIAVFRPSNGNWYIKGPDYNNWSNSGGNLAIQCGTSGDIPVPGDYIGDGKIRLAVFRPSNGNWYIKGEGTSSWGNTSENDVIQCGQNGDVPVPYDFFGEGKLRIAVWRPSDGNFYIKGSGLGNWGDSSGNIVMQAGTINDIPVKIASLRM